MTKAALQKLCNALKAQVNLKDEENNLKLQEETQKRIDIAKHFEATMGELTKLIETHSSHNKALREENISMASKLQELLRDFDGRDSKVRMVILKDTFRTKAFPVRCLVRHTPHPNLVHILPKNENYR